MRTDGHRAVPLGRDRLGLLWGAALADALAVIPAGWRGGDAELLPLPIGQARITHQKHQEEVDACSSIPSVVSRPISACH